MDITSQPKAIGYYVFCSNNILRLPDKFDRNKVPPFVWLGADSLFLFRDLGVDALELQGDMDLTEDEQGVWLSGCLQGISAGLGSVVGGSE